jgi:hypothetical protein
MPINPLKLMNAAAGAAQGQMPQDQRGYFKLGDPIRQQAQPQQNFDGVPVGSDANDRAIMAQKRAAAAAALQRMAPQQVNPEMEQPEAQPSFQPSPEMIQMMLARKRRR